MSSLDHAKIQLQETVDGATTPAFDSVTAVGKELVDISKEFDALSLRTRRFVDRVTPFIKEKGLVVPLEFLGGLLKRFRMTVEATEDIRKMLESGMYPPSLTYITELQMATRMIFTAATTGGSCVVRAHGKKFIASSKSTFTIPDARKEPERFEQFKKFLRDNGGGGIIKDGEPISHSATEAFLTRLMEKKDALLPTAETWLKLTTRPGITMKEDKE